jgi:protein kinase-like protein
MAGQQRDDESTETSAAPASLSSSSIDEGRFPAGTLVGGRYRVMALIGRGGMGEVYRAHDLILNQVVALKFLPAGTSANHEALVRLRNEVRIARQVSHPNVCRVYDIGVADGLHYLSMEYIDGENLASLLRRIGHLPHDKALEVTRRLCAGLAAAHDRGVLHRDFKPANIMIDARGQVRITDFGLAVLGEAPGDICSGTPLYMAPEQMAGKEVTQRSDLYALGLVLYELFTGRRPFEARTAHDLAQARATSPAPVLSGHVKDIDPAVERVILRCLEADPRHRPSSAFAVAAALPGGDPVAAALAAGETPSPEMVAASGEREGFRPAVAVVCFLVLLAGLAALPFLGDKVHPAGLETVPFSSEVLEVKGGEMLRRLGWPAREGFRVASGFHLDDNIFENAKSRGLRGGFKAHDPPLVWFHYRELPAWVPSLIFFGEGSLISGRISYSEPPDNSPGQALLFLDVTGKLLLLRVHPEEESAPSPAAPAAFDWNRLLHEAGFDSSLLKPVAPRIPPLVACDAQMAWEGAAWAGGTIPLRIEAASWRGRPVHFLIRSPYYTGTTILERRPLAITVAWSVQHASFLSLLFLACWTARRNLRSASGDRAGAWRLFMVAFMVMFSAQLAGQSHVGGFLETSLLMMALAWASLAAAITWVTYLAIEPAVRRSHPRMLITWSRLLAGRLRDPLVASHILGALALEVMILLVEGYAVSLSGGVSMIGSTSVDSSVSRMDGFLPLLSDIGWHLVAHLFVALSSILVWVLLARILHRDWAVFTALLVLAFLAAGRLDTPWPALVCRVASTAILVYVVQGFGLTGIVTALTLFALVERLPLTSRFGAWHSAYSLWIFAVIVLAAAFALHAVLRGRPLGTGSAPASRA